MAERQNLFVQYGAGLSAPEGWVNFDASPTLRAQKLPLVGRFVGGFKFPANVSYGDIVRGLPIPAGSVRGLYASHVLEHLALSDMRQALRNSYALLEPGGVFRLIVPDLLERASRYVDAARNGKADASHDFMHGTFLGKSERHRGVAGHLRSALGNSAHLWMWDYASMEAALQEAGFIDIRRAEMGDSGEPMFDRVEDPGRFVEGDITEVAIQARKPDVAGTRNQN